MFLNKFSKTFTTDLSISKEVFIDQFKKHLKTEEISLPNSSHVSSDYFTGEITSPYSFRIEKYYFFTQYSFCTIIGNGKLWQYDTDKLRINTRLNVRIGPNFKSPIAVIMYILVILFIALYLGRTISDYANKPTREMIFSFGGMMFFGFLIYYIRSDAKKRGLKKMQHELEQIFELIDLRGLRNRQL